MKLIGFGCVRYDIILFDLIRYHLILNDLFFFTTNIIKMESMMH